MIEKPFGRPTLYRPEYAQELIDYFCKPLIETDGDKPKAKLFPTLARFAAERGVNRDTIQEWAKNYPDFSGAVKQAKAYQEADLAEGAMSGLYAPAFSIFAAKNLMGWRDKTETEISGPDGAAMVQVVFVKPKEE